MAKIFARALLTVTALAFKVQDLVHGEEGPIQALHEAGVVDAHPDAVSYAKSTGATVVKLTNPGAAAELAEAMTDRTTDNGLIKPEEGLIVPDLAAV